LFDATKNEPMKGFYESLVPSIREFRRNSFNGDDHQARSAADHSLIISAIRRRDSKSARWFMLQHLWRLYDDVRQSGDAAAGKDWKNEWIVMFE
jgi:DNA-binding GntR family transcriptional regulator